MENLNQWNIKKSQSSYKELVILKAVKDTCCIYTVTTTKSLYLPWNSIPKKKQTRKHTRNCIS